MSTSADGRRPRGEIPRCVSIDVPCPRCRVEHNKACVDTSGRTIKTFHKERTAWAKTLRERMETDRFLRSAFRKGRRPNDLHPHGTIAAYRRHFREGTDPCPACRAANAAAWRRQYHNNNNES